MPKLPRSRTPAKNHDEVAKIEGENSNYLGNRPAIASSPFYAFLLTIKSAT